MDDPATWLFPDLVSHREGRHAGDHASASTSTWPGASVEEQQATVERLLALGATRADVGQPAGRPSHRPGRPRGQRLLRARSSRRVPGHGQPSPPSCSPRRTPTLRDFYVLATGWDLVRDSPATWPSAVVTAGAVPRGSSPGGARPRRRPQEPHPPGRLPREDEDQAAYVEQLLALGAARVDVGQGPEVTWVVLADRRATSSASCPPPLSASNSVGPGRRSTCDSGAGGGRNVA